MTEDPKQCPLTPRELYAAQVVGDHYEAKMRNTLREAVAAGIAVAIIAIGGGVTGWVLTDREAGLRAKAIKDEAAQRYKDLAAEAKSRADNIEDSRLNLLIRSCQDSKNRNTKTKAALDRLIRTTPSRQTTAERRRSITATKLLIDALSPAAKDCEASARARLSKSNADPAPPPPPASG